MHSFTEQKYAKYNVRITCAGPQETDNNNAAIPASSLWAVIWSLDMPIKITAWQCNFCGRYRKNKAAITRHEGICFRNPDRKILDGQLAVFSTMPRELLQWNSYGVEGSDWQEPADYPSKELLEKYKWGPLDGEGNLGLGYIYCCGKWEKLDGYEPPRFAPGFSWRNEVIPGQTEI